MEGEASWNKINCNQLLWLVSFYVILMTMMISSY